jgi:integrase
MCGRVSPTDRSTRSPRPTSAAGKRNWRGTSDLQRWRTADRWRSALTPEEAGRLLACFPLFWWDHVLCLLGTGLRFGELAGLRRRRVHFDRTKPVLEVGPIRYQAGRFGKAAA